MHRIVPRGQHVSSATSYTVEALLKRPEIPERVKAAFRRTLGQATCEEMMLWRDVASRLTLDAFGITPELTRVYDGLPIAKWHLYRNTVMSARAWFSSLEGEAANVFSLAGVDLAPIKETLRSVKPLESPAILGEPRNSQNRKLGKKLEPVLEE